MSLRPSTLSFRVQGSLLLDASHCGSRCLHEVHEIVGKRLAALFRALKERFLGLQHPDHGFAPTGIAFRKLEDRLRHPAGWLQLGAAIGCCGLLFHSFFDFNLHIPANALWFAACAALASAEIPTAARMRGY